jgi:hypothetical protein
MNEVKSLNTIGRGNSGTRTVEEFSGEELTTLNEGSGGRVFLMNRGTEQTAVVNAGVVGPGWEAYFYQYGAGATRFQTVPGGATLLSRGNRFVTNGQYAIARLRCVAPDVFIVDGDVTTGA